MHAFDDALDGAAVEVHVEQRQRDADAQSWSAEVLAVFDFADVVDHAVARGEEDAADADHRDLDETLAGDHYVSHLHEHLRDPSRHRSHHTVRASAGDIRATARSRSRAASVVPGIARCHLDRHVAAVDARDKVVCRSLDN